jgi:hypothetical protein
VNWQTDQDCEMIGGKGQRSNEEAMYNTYSPGIKLIPRVSWRKNRGFKQPEESVRSRPDTYLSRRVTGATTTTRQFSSALFGGKLAGGRRSMSDEQLA